MPNKNNKQEYKLIAVDLDDTLLDNELRVTAPVQEAVRRAVAAGVKFTFSTGRMFRSAKPYAELLGLDVPLITYQGALVINPRTGEEFQYLPLPLDCAREIVTHIHTLGYHLNAYLDDELYMEQDTQEGRRYQDIARVQPVFVGDLLRILDRPPIKLLTIAEEPLLDRLSEILIPKYAGRVHISKSKPYFLEFSHPLANKGAALEALAGHYGIKREEVIAVGDSYNDLEMLEYAGLGVMVANARDALKVKADYVTKGSNGDGVIEVIEKFVIPRF